MISDKSQVKEQDIMLEYTHRICFLFDITFHMNQIFLEQNVLSRDLRHNSSKND